MASPAFGKLVWSGKLWMSCFFFLFFPNFIRCEGEVRLVEGPTANQGRVEIFHDFQWGTVCDEYWDDSDARVVCRQLGYLGDVGEARSGGTYGEGSDPVHLYYAGCSGYESRLTDCRNIGWGTSLCGHHEDAGVYCGDEMDGDIRLVDANGGLGSDEGRVEIFHDYQWGTVCDDSWDDIDASVVCRQLGYSGNVGVARSGGTYGQGSGPIYLDNVGCSGYESRLRYCSNSGWGNHDCGHSEDAGVQCEDSPTQTTTQTTTQPPVKISPRVVSVMASVGVCLSLLTMLAITAVCWTCSTSKTAVAPRPSEPAIPLNTLSALPAGTNTLIVPASN